MPARPTICDLAEWLDSSGDGVQWSLGSPSDLNVNLVTLDPGHEIGEHTNADTDIVLVVVDGSGSVRCDDVTHPLATRHVAHIPKGTRRRVRADDAGMSYLTVHVRRSLGISSPPAR